jgi:drug/metabolite transporter (DMT)-like permease
MKAQQMRPSKWLGMVLATAGFVLMVGSGHLSHVRIVPVIDLIGGRQIQVDWYLLAGIIAVIGGGLLVQCGLPPRKSP